MSKSTDHQSPNEQGVPMLFSFESYDAEQVIKIKKCVRQLLKRPDLTPSQIRSIARLMLGLERLPLVTPGLSVKVGLVYRFKEAVSAYELYLGDDAFRVSQSSVENMGGFDSWSDSGVALEVEPGGFRNAPDDSSLIIWLNNFQSAQDAALEIEDTSSSEKLDWDHFDGNEYWLEL